MIACRMPPIQRLVDSDKARAMKPPAKPPSSVGDEADAVANGRAFG